MFAEILRTYHGILHRYSVTVQLHCWPPRGATAGIMACVLIPSQGRSGSNPSEIATYPAATDGLHSCLSRESAHCEVATVQATKVGSRR